ncbi:hypothetical protein L7F22_047228 [Adiantum nelumboides]|nr:hypothetical protein [Adiantum nelumboides]
MLFCTRETNVSSQDIYDTLLPLFNGGSTNVNSNEANVESMGFFENVTDQPIIDVYVHEVLDEERAKNEQARGFCHASYALDCYALAVFSLHDVEEPLSFDEAHNSKNWMAVMQSEYDALIKNDSWTLCDWPLGKKAIGTKWVYKLKRKSDGEIHRYKAPLVAKGYAQQKGIDYEENFAPTCHMTTVHFLCALAIHFGWDAHQSNIVTSFLNGHIFEQELFKLFGTQLRFSSAYHPQTDGQTERINQGIEDYIRSYVQADQKDWVNFLEVLEFQYNRSVHTGTGYAPFELATGKEVITPMALAFGAIHAQDLDAKDSLANWKKCMEVARKHLVTYKEKYVAKANEKARAEFFQAGNLVLVSSQNINLSANLTPKFNHRYYGPYRIVRDFNNVSYQLELPTNVRIHNVFHASPLKRFHVDKKFGRHVPLLDKGVNPFEPKIILKHRFVRKYPEFYVKWRGRPMSNCTWVPEDKVIVMDKQLLLRYYNMPELRHISRI